MVEKISFKPNGEEEVEFYVLEQVRLNGYNYLLVTEDAEGDGIGYIMKDVAGAEDKESVYVMVEDDVEMDAVAEMFEDMLDDVELVNEKD